MRRFIYLDTDTLNSYLAQIFDGLIQSQEMEKTAGKKKEKQNHFGSNLGSQIAFKLFGKGIDANAQATYYSFMWQIRQSLYENYGITVLQNLEKFQEYTGTDELDKQYYELVANAFSNPKTEQKHNSNTRFYIQKRTPFYVGKERYFEVTLQQADIYASKYNRITAYTQLDICTG